MLGACIRQLHLNYLQAIESCLSHTSCRHVDPKPTASFPLRIMMHKSTHCLDTKLHVRAAQQSVQQRTIKAQTFHAAPCSFSNARQPEPSCTFIQQWRLPRLHARLSTQVSVLGPTAPSNAIHECNIPYWAEGRWIRRSGCQPARGSSCRLKSSAAADGCGSLTILPDGGCWSSVERWVVFSDLHVSLKTCSTCLEVLRTVRSLAEEHKAGVLFLGDFWDARGSLPVEPLNAVLEEFGNWTQPMIMLVGNHDQVSLGGQMHSLDPFSVAFPHFRIMSEPTLFLGALWLPYRRREEVLKEAISTACQSSSGFKAIFAHADIVGAQWNATYQGKDGLPPDLFPGAVPVYTGHYHIPHTVKDTSITYVGSPYQVSMSETQQQKRLLLLDKHFQLLSEIPVSIGPKYHEVSGLDIALPSDLNPGDFVRWKLPTSEVPTGVTEMQQQLLQQGVHVEVVVQPKSSAPRIEAAEQLSPQQLLQQYAISTDMSPEAHDKAQDILKSSSLGTSNQLSPPIQLQLEEMEIMGYGPFKDSSPVTYPLRDRGLRVVSGCNEDDDSTDSNGAGKTSLVMAAYWAITGDAYSRSEASSRGQLRNAQILNEKSKKCRVTLTGTVNSKPFNITRTLMKSKSSLSFELDGEDVTQQDMKLTQQRVNEVFASSLLPHTVFFGQSNIVGLLEANDSAFKAKLGEIVDWTVWEELHELGKQQFREAELQLRLAEEGCRGCEQRAVQLREQSQQLRIVVEQWEQQQQMDKDRLVTEVEQCKQHLQQQVLGIAALCDKLETQLGQVQSELRGTGTQQQRENELAIYKELERLQEKEGELQREYDKRQTALSNEAVEAQQHYMELNRNAYTIQGQLQAAEGRLQQYEALRSLAKTPTNPQPYLAGNGAEAQQLQASPVQLLVSPHHHDSVEGVVCDKCLQRVDPSTYQHNLRSMWDDIERLRQQHQQCLDTAAAAELKMQQVARQVLQSEEEQRALMQQLRNEQQSFQSQLLASQQEAAVQQRKHLEQQAMADIMANLLNRGRMSLEAVQQVVQLAHSQPTTGLQSDTGLEDISSTSMLMDQAINAVNSGLAAYSTAAQQLEFWSQRVCKEAARLEQVVSMLGTEETKLADFQASAAAHKHSLKLLGAAVEAFSRSGIPSFVLEGVLGELQDRTATYTSRLASGMMLVLNATKPTKSRNAKKDVQEQIDKFVRVKVDDVWRERGIEQLSGGERRRVALALALAFADLAAQRGRFSCNLIVLDEILQQLDQEGCSRVAEVLKGLPHSSVLVVGQAHSFVTQEFDVIDVVVKSGGTSTVRLG